MKNYKFLVPLSAAVAALGTAPAYASIETDATQNNMIQDAKMKASEGALIGVTSYLIGAEEHILLMKRSQSGVMYAAHGSHSSHSSHGSHRSHRSGR